jgi:hypothetical protein
MTAHVPEISDVRDLSSWAARSPRRWAFVESELGALAGDDGACSDGSG